MSILDRAESERDFALSVLLHVGALTTCMIHDDDIYEGNGDLEAAYKYANSQFTRKDNPMSFEDRREMTDIIKSIYEEYCGCDSCPSCESNFRE
ncbi:hypothetical protein [Kosakonia cowanii]|uniref:hypothetical protein n=1 Tax=Kosakonia cowanii TaxID=208223 RepID=UPI0030762E12